LTLELELDDMTTQLIIWLSAITLYLLFALWYFGFRRKLKKEEVEVYLKKLAAYDDYKDQDLRGLKEFLTNDDGKSFVMVNSILLKEKPDLVEGVEEGDKSLKVLIKYHKSFMGMMIKRAGIGIFQGRVAGQSVDLIGIENAEQWGISAINRFRSRRDFIEILIHPKFHEKHQFKFAALEKSIAYPVSPWFQLGGFPLTVALVLALLAAIGHIISI
tara:strand:+ start:4287 stop:4934 length:648 start_codon:yes stop_codon:yes gene_type:complete